MAREPDRDSEESAPPGSPRSSRPRARRIFGPQHTEAARAVIACQKCREKKVKCDGQWPCKYCSKRNLTCLFNASEKRKMFSVSEVRELKAKVARYENSSNRERPDADEETPTGTDLQEPAEEAQCAPSATTKHQQQQQQPEDSSVPTNSNIPRLDQGSGTILRSPVSNGPHALATPRSSFSTRSNGRSALDPIPISPSVPTTTGSAPMAPETALSSTDAFGSEVRTLLGSRPHPGSAKTTPAAASSTMFNDVGGLDGIPGWPTEEEANTLLELTVLHVGISQQLFDVRAFSDNLSRLYHDPSAEQALSSMWFTEALLVMAIGRLLLAKSDGSSSIPGDSFYNMALRRLPRLGESKKHGLIGVETIALTALYLQIADRKDEAYLYASMALRVAITHNLHNKRLSEQRVSRSEAVHRNRLWWSVYMQERRLAAAGGHPMGIDDKAVTVDPPSDAFGFPSAAAIAVNVRAARITGQITWTIYSSHGSSEVSFINDVQNILTSLHEIRATMPAEYHMSTRDSQLTIAGRLFAEVDQQTARTSSSLYLSVHQAVIHAVRPILLYMARSSGDGDSEAYNDLSPTLRRLAEICVEAASKSLVILNELREREIIAKNAFLDLDAVFSVGFIFVLVEVINRGKNLGKSGIDGSRSILEYLVGLGNRAAAKRLAEMDQMCAHLEPQADGAPLAEEPAADFLTDNFSFELGYMNPETAANHYRDADVSSVHRNNLVTDVSAADNLGNIPAPIAPGDLWMNADLADISLEGENGLFWVFQPGFYTGEELADWETLETCLAMNQASNFSCRDSID